MLLLAVVLWRMASRPQATVQTVTYNDFVSELEHNNIRSAEFTVDASTATLQGTLKESGEKVEVRIAKELIADLTTQLKAANVPTTFKAGTATDARSTLLNFAPMVLLVGFWLYLIRAMRKSRSTPSSLG